MSHRFLPATFAACLVLAACGGSDGGADTTVVTEPFVAENPVTIETPVATPAPTATAAEEPAMVVEGATVIVANGNISTGSAGRMATTLESAGFTTGPPTNASVKVDASVVYFSAAAGAQAVAESLATKMGGVDVAPLPEEIPTEDGGLAGGDVLLILGNDEADKTLEELSGVATGDESAAAITNQGSTVVVANANATGGSAGAMTDRIKAAGFTTGSPINATTTISDSIVYYAADAAAQADAEALALALGGIEALALPAAVATEAGSFDGDVLLMLGSNDVEKTLNG